jgi:endonuclease G, mitochondrial
MKKSSLSFIIICLVSLSSFSSCSKDKKEDIQQEVDNTIDTSSVKPIIATMSETFEKVTKTSYSPSAVTFSSGLWYFNDALIGTSSADRKKGANAVRLVNSGKITMLFDKPNGADTVQVRHAIYGSDDNSSWELWMSANSGSLWTKVGSTVNTNSTSLSTANFIINQPGNVRFEIRKTGGDANRLNIDNFLLNDYYKAPSDTTKLPTDTTKIPTDTTKLPAVVDDDNMMLGNPSNATSSIVNVNNYLMVKPQYCTSYNSSKLTPNWTSWHLTSTDLAGADRQDDYRADATLPSGWYQVGATSYSGSGFDRGHMCPSADRLSSIANNSATFLMTNMIPQAPKNNQETWENLENYSRTLVKGGNELYIISGPYGQGGTGSNGFANTIGIGIVVPAKTWKIIVVLSNGNSDLGRINTSTRVMAVLMPNDQTVSSQPWGNYRVSVDSIESLTGYDFLSNVPANIQNIIEAKVDNGVVQ